MGDILDLNKKLEAANQPNPEHVYTDPDGLKWYQFLCHYKVNGKEFCLTFWAVSEEHAQEHIAGIKQSIEYDGQLHAEIDF